MKESSQVPFKTLDDSSKEKPEWYIAIETN